MPAENSVMRHLEIGSDRAIIATEMNQLCTHGTVLLNRFDLNLILHSMNPRTRASSLAVLPGMTYPVHGDYQTHFNTAILLRLSHSLANTSLHLNTPLQLSVLLLLLH